MQKSLISHEDKKRVKMNRRIMGVVRSPFLVNFRSAFQDHMNLYITMDYYPGGDLGLLLSALGVIEEAEAVQYFAEMIMGVKALHSCGVIHRDLKPDNFLIDASGHLKLSHFDFSTQENVIYETPCRNEGVLRPRHHFALRAIRSDAYYPPTRPKLRKKVYSVIGSPDYMSPEVTAGLSKPNSGYDEATDWWSLGCCLFEMIFGAPPFQGETPEETFNNINNYKSLLSPLHDQYRELISSECFNLIEGFLCEPEKRFGRDIEKLQSHPFFKSIDDWTKLHERTPPYVPKEEYIHRMKMKINQDKSN